MEFDHAFYPCPAEPGSIIIMILFKKFLIMIKTVFHTAYNWNAADKQNTKLEIKNSAMSMTRQYHLLCSVFCSVDLSKFWKLGKRHMNKVQKIRYPLYLLQLSNPTIHLTRVQLQDAGMPPTPCTHLPTKEKKMDVITFYPTFITIQSKMI